MDGSIVFRNPSTFEQIGVPLISPAGVGDVAFLGDGKRLLGINYQTGSYLWDLESRTRIGDEFAPGMQAWPDADGNDRGVSADGDNIYVWNLKVDEWYEIACRAAGRNMTRDEWNEIGPRDAEYQATCAQFPLEG